MFPKRKRTPEDCLPLLTTAVDEMEAIVGRVMTMAEIFREEHGVELAPETQASVEAKIVEIRDEYETGLHKRGCYAVLQVGETAIRPLCNFKQCPFGLNGPSAAMRI